MPGARPSNGFLYSAWPFHNVPLVSASRRADRPCRRSRDAHDRPTTLLTHRIRPGGTTDGTRNAGSSAWILRGRRTGHRHRGGGTAAVRPAGVRPQADRAQHLRGGRSHPARRGVRRRSSTRCPTARLSSSPPTASPRRSRSRPRSAACGPSTRPARWSPRSTRRPYGSPTSGYEIVLIGHADHEEVEGTAGRGPDHMHVVDPAGPDDAGPPAGSAAGELALPDHAVGRRDHDAVRRLRERFPAWSIRRVTTSATPARTGRRRWPGSPPHCDLVVVVVVRQLLQLRSGWSRSPWGRVPAPPTWWTEPPTPTNAGSTAWRRSASAPRALRPRPPGRGTAGLARRPRLLRHGVGDAGGGDPDVLPAPGTPVAAPVARREATGAHRRTRHGESPTEAQPGSSREIVVTESSVSRDQARSDLGADAVCDPATTRPKRRPDREGRNMHAALRTARLLRAVSGAAEPAPGGGARAHQGVGARDGHARGLGVWDEPTSTRTTTRCCAPTPTPTRRGPSST